jgi:hypothetical protein
MCFESNVKDWPARCARKLFRISFLSSSCISHRYSYIQARHFVLCNNIIQASLLPWFYPETRFVMEDLEKISKWLVMFLMKLFFCIIYASESQVSYQSILWKSWILFQWLRSFTHAEDGRTRRLDLITKLKCAISALCSALGVTGWVVESRPGCHGYVVFLWKKIVTYNITSRWQLSGSWNLCLVWSHCLTGGINDWFVSHPFWG